MLRKKSERLLLRVTEDMARQVRQFADIHHRTIQDELRYLISCGFHHIAAEGGKEINVKSRQLLSSDVGKKESAA